MSGLHQRFGFDFLVSNETISDLSVQPSVIEQITIMCALGCC